MYNGVDYPQDYPYYEPTSNSSMNWQNQNSQQQGAHPQAPSHPSQLPQNQSARFNRFNGHHARDDQDHQSQEFVRIFMAHKIIPCTCTLSSTKYPTYMYIQ